MTLPEARGQRTPGGDLPEDAVLVERVLNGDVEAFGILVDRYQDTFATYATRMTGSVDDAIDIIQESMFRAYRALRHCKNPANFKGWLFRIVSNRCKTHLATRQRRRTERLDCHGPRLAAPDNQGVELERHDERRAIERALQELPVEQREAVVLRYIEGFSVREIAAAVGVSPSAVKMRLHRARAALRTRLEDVGG